MYHRYREKFGAKINAKFSQLSWYYVAKKCNKKRDNKFFLHLLLVQRWYTLQKVVICSLNNNTKITPRIAITKITPRIAIDGTHWKALKFLGLNFLGPRRCQGRKIKAEIWQALW